MKKYSIYLLAAAALLSNVALTSCDDDNVLDANEVLAVKSVLPVKVMEGQVVTITGTGLDNATAVVFPGGAKVTDITKVGSSYITVVTPSGISAEGGNITVEADGQTVASTTSLAVGQPKVARVAPLDAEIKINQCVEVYGTDLEFITSAVFPGADGSDIVVNADNFRRKSTSALYIYSPMGVRNGVAEIVLEDCAGNKYTLPEVSLSDKVAGASDAPVGEGYYPVWEGSVDITAWESTLYLGADQFNLDGFVLKEGMMMRLVFDCPNGSHVWVTDGGWGNLDLDGAGGNNAYPEAGATSIEFPVSAGLINCLGEGGSGIIIGADSDGITLTRIELYKEYPVLWSGEHETGWWWYMPYTDLDLSAVTPEAGQIIRFTFKEHTVDQTFCLCDGWWGTPLIREEEGRDPNNVAIKADENFIDFEITSDMASTMRGEAENCFIIGGEVIVTKIQIKTF